MSDLCMVSLLLAGAALYLFATTSMGVFPGTFASLLPQFGPLSRRNGMS